MRKPTAGMATAIVLAVMLSACGTAASPDTDDIESAPTATGGPSVGPTGEPAATPTSTPTESPAQVAPPAPDLEPARIAFDPYGMTVFTATGTGVDYISFDLTATQAVAKLTELLGVTPTRVEVPAVNSASQPELYGASGIAGYDFGGVTVFPSANPVRNRRYVVRVTTTQIAGITIDSRDVGAGVSVGVKISKVVSAAGYGWPEGSLDYLFGNENWGIDYYITPGGTTVAGFHIPFGT